MVETAGGGLLTGLAVELAREQRVLDAAHSRLEELRALAVHRERESLGGPRGGTPQALYERDVVALAAAARRSTLDDAGEGLVFGRLDVVEGEPLHVGRLGLRTENQEPIVVDWRAPAAAAFYRATAAEPLGVVRRRTLTSRGPQVVGLEDELLDPSREDRLEGTVVVGDGAFLAAVARERGPHMRDIVATIQREQDEAVRAPDDGALVVTGGPGTGKTAVALHRVAYLMYARREYYGRRGVLVVGPSPLFVDYIGAVLPSLGETSVRLASLGSLPDLPGGLRCAGYDPPATAVAKGSLAMAELLRRTVRQVATARQPGPLELTHWGTTVTVKAAELAALRSRVARSHRSHNAGRSAFRNQVVEAAWRAWQRGAAAAREEHGDRDAFADWLVDAPALEAVLDTAWPVLDPLSLLRSLLDGTLPLRRLADGLLDQAAQAALLAGPPPGGDGAVTAADAALLDELAELLGPPPEPEPDAEDAELAELEARARASEVTTFADRTRVSARAVAEEEGYRTFAHVVVDEAQDVTPMQWRMLGRRARGATWTVVGDWAQSAWPDVEEVRRALHDCLGRARVRQAELTTNYRTSTEIAGLAARLLVRIDPSAKAPAAVRSTGHEPSWLVGLDRVEAAVTEVLGQVGGTVGVICPRALVTSTRARLSGLAEPRLSVVDTWEVKGLEYDGCVVVAPETVLAEGGPPVAGLRSLYVAVTRATQRLTVVSALDRGTVLDGPR